MDEVQDTSVPPCPGCGEKMLLRDSGIFYCAACGVGLPPPVVIASPYEPYDLSVSQRLRRR